VPTGARYRRGGTGAQRCSLRFVTHLR
jgi:hypothetical protein